MGGLEWVLLVIVASSVSYGVSKASARVLTAKVMRAETFVLMDPSGRALAVLGRAVGGYAGLALRDESGAVRAMLALTPEGAPTLGLSDHRETARIAAGLDESGEPRLAIYDGNGNIVWQAP